MTCGTAEDDGSGCMPEPGGGTPTTCKGQQSFSPTPASTTLGSQDASPQTIVTEEEEPEDFARDDLDSLTMDIVDFVLPPPAIPVDEKLTQVDTPVPDVSDDAPTWSSNARLPQLRIRTFRMSPYLSPQMSPKTPEKHRRRNSRALDDAAMTPITRAQLREGATGVEDVLNRVRYDLLECTEAASFTVLVENAELPDLCRHHLLRGECRYGQHCRYQHVTPVRWLSGSSPPSSSSGSHVAYVEALETSKLFLLLDSAPCHMARHALLQTVAFVLYKGEVVWCRHLGRPDRQQLWDSFLALHGPGDRAAPRGEQPTAELMMLWPGNVWERLFYHLQDPCVISGAASALLCSCRGVHQSALTDQTLWRMLARAECLSDWPSLAQSTERSLAAKDPFKNYAALSQNVHHYRLCLAACQSGPGKAATPKLGPEVPTPVESLPAMSPKCEPRCIGTTSHVEVGFEVTALRGSSTLTVAASRRSNEIRLFQSRNLGRLPALRLVGRPGVDALDLAPENDVLVAGGVDGQLTIHALSDPAASWHRLGRFCKPPSRDAAFPNPLFAGLHFVQGTGGTQVLVAARSLNTAQLLDVVKGSVVESRTVGSQDLVACEPLGEHGLLMNAEGMVRLWDARAPDLVHLANLALTAAECKDGPHLSVNVGDPAAAILSNSTLRWVDLRAGRVSEVCPAALWPEIFREAGPARLVMARRGLVAAWFDSPTLPIGCYFGAGPSLAPMNADFSNAAVTVSSVPLGGGTPPFAVALARPSRRRRRLVYEVCSATP